MSTLTFANAAKMLQAGGLARIGSSARNFRRKRPNKTPPSGRGGVWTYPPKRGVRGTRSSPLMLRTPPSPMRAVQAWTGSPARR